jgi:enoyl-[acyl-carrier protein] reductase / trans-2-enoyl-CoA reductase (NAD+)
MAARVVRPDGRGLLLFDAHPVGCRRFVDELAASAGAIGPVVPQARQPAGAGRPVALIIGSSAGYGLAATVTALVRHGMRGVGVCYERPASAHRTATAGWYRAIHTATLAERIGTDFTLVNGDCFSDETKMLTARLLAERYGRVDYLVYSVAAPRRTDQRTGAVQQAVIRPIGSAYHADTLTFGPDGRADLSTVLVEPATAGQCTATVAVMGGGDWAAWAACLARNGLIGSRFRTVALSYVGPESTSPIYRRGTIGAAKEHLERTAVELTEGPLRQYGGRALVSVNGVAVTVASAAIPGIPLYIALLRRVLGDRMQSPAQQLAKLWAQLTGDEPLAVDDSGRLRLDDWELRADVQREVALARRLIGARAIDACASTGWFLREVRRLYGFDVDGVDYTEPVEPDVPWPEAGSQGRSGAGGPASTAAPARPSGSSASTTPASAELQS